MRHHPLGTRATALVVFIGVFVAACAVNPATGRRQFMLISEGQEIAMGQEYDPQIVGSMGLYGGEEWQSYMQRLGARMAALSERPNLPWTFRVVNDPIVNAFAVPGGYVYMTRGILAHFNSEAQLAAVLGHEIGHVTARHSASQLSNQTLLQGALGVGSILAPRLQTAFGIANAGLGVLFLKFSRDDESESDQLGLGYMVAAGYDPRPMPEVYTLLGRVAAAAGAGGTPEWLSTHPNPDNREERIRSLIAQLPDQDFADHVVNRDAYLQRLEGMVYGENPRDGFFEDNLFKHPDLEFEMAFPTGWRTQNQTQGVVGVSADQDAILQLTISQAASPQAAAQAFFAQAGLTGDPAPFSANGTTGVRGPFTANTEEGVLSGYASFADHGGRVYQIVGYGTDAGWQANGSAVRTSIGSFQRLTDRAALAVQPRRISIQRTDIPTALRPFNTRYPSVVPVEELALINQIELSETIPAGTLLKRVVQ